MQGVTTSQDGGHDNGTYITEVKPEDEEYGEDGKDELEDSDKEEKSNMIFNVREAVPPTDYDAPYSQLPKSVTLRKVKMKVKMSYT